MFNKVIIVGNLTRDPESRPIGTGGSMAVLGLASNRRFNRNDGTKGDETCFVDVKLFGRAAEVAMQYLHKGSKVLIEGRLVYDTWTDQSGQKRSKHSIVSEGMQMLDGKQDSNHQDYQNQGGYNGGGYSGGYNSGSGYSGGNAGNAGGGGSGGYGNSYSQNSAQNASGYASQSALQRPVPAQNYEQNIPSIDIDDDEIPF